MRWLPALDNQEFSLSSEDLPALIHGEKGSGASLFSVVLAKQLYKQGEPLLILNDTKKNQELLTLDSGDQSELSEITSEKGIRVTDKQILFVQKENEELIPILLTTLEDFSERIVVINKFEEFNKETLSFFYTHPKTIYCGDLNRTEAKEQLLQLKYNTKIFYSPLYNDFRLTLPELEKYHGYYQGRTATGTVSLQEDNK